MRILLIGEYSNVHATLASALRTLGHEATVLSNGDFWKDYPRDINLERKPGKWGGVKYVARLLRLLPQMRGYDVVHLINPMFLELKAGRIMPVYRYLRRHNRMVTLGAYGMDWYWVDTCRRKKPLRYSDFNIGDTLREDDDAMREVADWCGTAKERLNRHIAADCDGVVAGLYEYYVCYQPVFPDKTVHIPYPIDLSSTQGIDIIEVKRDFTQQPLTIFIGINKKRHTYKGTDVMLAAAQRLHQRYPTLTRLQVAESVPFAEYSQMMNSSDVILDQLYSYTPSMNSLLAMSKGLICVGGGEPEHYALIGEKQLRPIINVTPSEQSVYDGLEQLVLHPEKISRLQHQSKEYIRKHHDHLAVARHYLDFWEKIESREQR